MTPERLEALLQENREDEMQEGIAELVDEVKRLRTENTALRGLLWRAQWTNGDKDTQPTCLWCGGWEARGHTDECELFRFLTPKR